MQRYDRQIRLLSEEGQKILLVSSAIVIGTSIAMAETVKNLMLAGIGQLTIIDDFGNLTTPRFPVFGDMSHLNSHTKITNFIPSTANVVVIAHHLVANNSQLVQKWEIYAPMIVIGSDELQGFVGLHFRHPLCVLDPHLTHKNMDLRFKYIWPELQEFSDSIALDSLSDIEHSHVPYAILLIKAAQMEDEDVVVNLKTMQRFPDEENFQEAIKYAGLVNQLLVPDQLYDAILAYDTPHNIFWDHVQALRMFISNNSCLPVSGEIPDMISSPELYTKLKTIYKKKHEDDKKELRSYLLYSYEREDFLKTFTRCSRSIQVVVPGEEIWRYINPQFANVLEVAPVSAVVGGIAAQEATKILTLQYTPMASIIYYDARTETTLIEKLGAEVLNN